MTRKPRNYMPSWRRKFAQGYIEAAQWSSTDPDTEEPLDTADLAPGEAYKLARLALQWARRHESTLDQAADHRYHPEYDPWELLGHDTWLTQCGHGTGFWDRSELGDSRDPFSLASILTEHAKELPEHASGWIDPTDGLARFEW